MGYDIYEAQRRRDMMPAQQGLAGLTTYDAMRDPDPSLLAGVISAGPRDVVKELPIKLLLLEDL